jgi:hypothetical protein
MRRSNGGEGQVGPEGYLQLWPIETLVEMNKNYDAVRSYPGHVLVGSNGGGEAITLRHGPAGLEFVLLPSSAESQMPWREDTRC